MTQMLTNVRGKVKSGHANLSFFLALIGGFCAAFSPPGAPMRGFAGLFAWWFSLLAFTILFVVCLGDWASEGIPNRPAVYTAILWPSALLKVLTGTCGDRLFEAIRWIGGRTGGWGADWQRKVDAFLHVGAAAQSAYTAFAVAFITAALVYAQRYAKSSKKAAAMGGSR